MRYFCDNYLSPINAVFLISYFYCKHLLLTGFYFEKVHRERTEYVAFCCGSQETVRKEKNDGRSRQNKHGEGYGTFTWPFSFQSSSRRRSRQRQVICKHCNVELSYHRPVLRSYDCTVPIKVRYMLLLNSLLDFAYNNAINRD